MPSETKHKKIWTIDSLQDAVQMIACLQMPDGVIPWCHEGKIDPWDHIESAMGLSVGGYLQEARLAFEWMRANQLKDGSWYSGYLHGHPSDRTRETHFATYIAVGVYHYYLISGDDGFLAAMWPMIRRAINFALRMQAPGGEIYWAISPRGRIDQMALLTGSSSVFMSIKCALAMAKILADPMPEWRVAWQRLAYAIQCRPHAFNMTKSRFAMDWFYPVLSGVFTGEAARRRMDQSWKKFVINDHGVRCVSDRPWVTIAETAELVLALAAMDRKDLARIVMHWIIDKRFEDGTYWCGYTVPDRVVWPEERLSWTNAAVLMAADALYSLTPACDLFHHRFWEPGSSPKVLAKLSER
jgi:hypothetical protein